MVLNRKVCAWLAAAAAVLFVLGLPEIAFAAPTKVGVGPIDAVTKAVVDAAKGWIPVLQNYARGVFVALAAIQIGWIGIRHSLSGNPEIGSALGAVALEFVTLGFFAVLISEGPGWAEAIVLSLQEAGRVAAGGAAGETPQQILDEVAALGVKVIEDLTLLNAITSGLAMAIGSLGLLALTALIAGLILVGWVQAWVVVGAGSILLGLGGSSWTRSMATNYLRHALGAGIKLMVLELMSGVLLGHIKAWVDEAHGDFGLELLVHVLLSLTVMAIMVLTVPAYVSSIVTGAVMNGGEAMAMRVAAAAAFFGAGKAMAVGRAGKGASVSGSSTQATSAGAMESSGTAAPGLVGAGGARAPGGARATARAGASPGAVRRSTESGAVGEDTGAPARGGAGHGGAAPPAEAGRAADRPVAGRAEVGSGRPAGRQGGGASGRRGVGRAGDADAFPAGRRGPGGGVAGGAAAVTGPTRGVSEEGRTSDGRARDGASHGPAVSAPPAPASASAPAGSPRAGGEGGPARGRSSSPSGSAPARAPGAASHESGAGAGVGPKVAGGGGAVGAPAGRAPGRAAVRPSGDGGAAVATHADGGSANASGSGSSVAPAGPGGHGPAQAHRPASRNAPAGAAASVPRHAGPTRLEVAMSGGDGNDTEEEHDA